MQTFAQAGELLPQQAIPLLAEVLLKSQSSLGVAARTQDGGHQGAHQEGHHDAKHQLLFPGPRPVGIRGMDARGM